jgi:hypothetical protein
VYAVAVNVTIESGREDEAQESLRANVIPRVKESPGLVAAYFMDPGGGYGYSLLVFDSEENANAAKQMAENAPRPEFVKLGTAQVMEVIESV